MVGRDRESGVEGERDVCDSLGIRDGEAGAVVGVEGEGGRRLTEVGEDGEYGSCMDEADGESTRWKYLFVFGARDWTRTGWMWVANVSLETGAGFLNDEGGEELVEVSVRDVHSNLGTDVAVGEGEGISVGGVR